MRARNFVLLATAVVLSTGRAAGAAGSPALRTLLWAGIVNNSAMSLTLYGNDIELRRHEPDYDATSIPNSLVRKYTDNGVPLNLPDPGVPPMLWHARGGPWTYGNGTTSYEYTCGQEATASEHSTRDGAYKLRNMGSDMAVTAANSCARHWCHDTTAMFVCNDLKTDLSIPYYNVGWMADRLDRLCCSDNGGKSGQMWHYSLNYSVVLGYANCQTEAATSWPYPYGEGNNALCLEGGEGS